MTKKEVKEILKSGRVPKSLRKEFSNDYIKLANNVHSFFELNSYQFSDNVLKQGRCTEKQAIVLAKMYVQRMKEYSFPIKEKSYIGSLDRDEMIDHGYESHPGEFDGY